MFLGKFSAELTCFPLSILLSEEWKTSIAGEVEAWNLVEESESSEEEKNDLDLDICSS